MVIGFVMGLDFIRHVLGWSALINFGLLAVWFLVFITAHDWLYSFHVRWFQISVEEFDKICYLLMGIYKLATVLLCLVPYVVMLSMS